MRAMRDKIRLPADVEFSTSFLALNDGEGSGPAGGVEFTIESVPNGRFNKVTKVVIKIAGVDAIVITPKERAVQK